uniref:Exocyst complex component Sec8 n=1 Tax=Eutreptiella gymnastica TaxID=73025 RepID=A0A7S4LA75_9EUGL
MATIHAIDNATGLLPYTSKQYHKLLRLSQAALLALKVEVRARCHFFLQPFTDWNYHQESDSMEPSPFVTQYNADVARFHSMICQHLRPSAYALLFDTIPELVAHHLIHKLPHIPNQCINSIGIKQLRRNLFALQQNLATMAGNQEECFNRVRKYYELLTLTSKELLRRVHQGHEGVMFTLGQYEAILSIKTELHTPNSHDLSQLRTLHHQHMFKKPEAQGQAPDT